MTEPAARKKQRLEEGVRHQVEDGGGVCGDSAAKEHVAKLRDGGVGEDALDVVLHQPMSGGEEGSGRSDDGDHAEREAASGRRGSACARPCRRLP